MANEIKLGDRAKDRLTGFTGIVTGIHKFISGCNKVTLAPEELKDGKPVETQWFDVQFIEVIKPGAFPLDNGKTPGGPDRSPSGPQR